jgi:nucleoside-diphosphate-sugar epimerase
VKAALPRAIAVSGATGYVGTTLLSYLDTHGYETVPLTRNPSACGSPAREFSLGAPLQPGLLDGVDCLVHAAWDMTLTDVADSYMVNVVGSQALIRAARDAGVQRIVFISSMSAYEGTRQFYGRAKLEIESLVSSIGGVSLRLGLVYGHDARGMAGALASLSKLPIVPVPGGNRSYQFLLDAVELGPAIERALVGQMVGVVGVANPSRRTVPDVIRTVSGQAASGRFVSVPWQPIFYAMRIAERLGAKLPLRSDSLLGLVRPAPGVPNADVLGITYN